MKKKRGYQFEEAAAMLKVMAHPVRLSIVSLLEGKKMKVGDIQAEMGIKQSIASQHLNAMAAKGILGRDRVRNEVYYYIKKKDILKLLSCIEGCCGV